MSWDTELAADGPRSWWRFDDPISTAVPDFGTDGNDGTLLANVQQIGASGHRYVRPTDLSVRLPFVLGDDDPDNGGYMEADAALFGTPATWTLEAVIWPDGPPPSDHDLFIVTHAENEGVDDGYSMFVAADGRVGIELTNAAGTGGDTPPNRFQADGGEVCWVGWNHVAATYSASTLRIYHNGDLVGTRVVTGGQTYAAGRQLLVGRQAKEERRGDRWFDGKISEVAIYDYALSADRIAAHAATAPWCRSSGWIVGAAALG